MSGTQMQHAKESNADIMRQKQAAGMSEPYPKTQKRLLQMRRLRTNRPLVFEGVNTNRRTYSRGSQGR